MCSWTTVPAEWSFALSRLALRAAHVGVNYPKGSQAAWPAHQRALAKRRRKRGAGKIPVRMVCWSAVCSTSTCSARCSSAFCCFSACFCV